MAKGGTCDLWESPWGRADLGGKFVRAMEYHLRNATMAGQKTNGTAYYFIKIG